MIDHLREIISATHNLGFLELVKVTGTDTTTELNSVAADKTVLLNSKFVQPHADFIGTFGLHDLDRLNTILNIPEYKENAVITVDKETRNGEEVPVGISFKNANGDFSNSYRFMSKELVETQLPSRSRKHINWDVTVQPTVQAIQRLKFQAQAAGSGEGTFHSKVSKNNLVFSIGDHSTHTGEFVFASGITGKLTGTKEWPLGHVQAILNLVGDKVMEISDAGAMQITVTSGLAIHQYTILAACK